MKWRWHVIRTLNLAPHFFSPPYFYLRRIHHETEDVIKECTSSANEELATNAQRRKRRWWKDEGERWWALKERKRLKCELCAFENFKNNRIRRLSPTSQSFCAYAYSHLRNAFATLHFAKHFLMSDETRNALFSGTSPWLRRVRKKRLGRGNSSPQVSFLVQVFIK